MTITEDDEFFTRLYRTGKYPAFNWLWYGKSVCESYFMAKRKILLEYWDKKTLKEMETHFNEKIWSKTNWEIYKSYHYEEIRRKQLEYRTKCECGGSYDDVPSKKNKHLKTKKHQDFVNTK